MSQDTSFGIKTPRVLLAGHLPPPMSGIGTFYQTLLASSLPRRIDLRFIDTSLRRRLGSETGKWSFPNLISAIGDCIRFAKVLLTYRPEICHIATSVGLSFLKHSVCVLMARVAGSKVLLHPHCSFYFFYERYGKVWQWFVRKVVGSCQGVVVLSNEWKALKTVLPDCQIYYLPNAIDLSVYAEIGQEKIASRRDRTCVRVLYLGHLGKDKGSFDLIHAARLILTRERDVIFELVGQEQVAGDMKRLNAEVVDAGFEQFIHIRTAVTGEEKIRLLRSADVFAYPSYHEGMPMAVLEAMACGMPVIATDIGGLPDLVQSGANGLLVPAGQPDQLAHAIHKLVSDPHLRHSMQECSFKLAKENFDVEKLVVRLVDIYQCL